MAPIISSLSEIAPRYGAVFCDLWGCLHNGRAPFPEAVSALRAFRQGGGRVILLTNAPRPAGSVIAQLDRLGVPHDAYDGVVSSGDAAQEGLVAGLVGRRVFHIGAEKDLPFFTETEGDAAALARIERVPLAEAEGVVCTGLLDDATETPEDYRAVLLEAKARDLPMLCANPDIVVDHGTSRLYCAGAIAQAYEEMGGRALYFGKPHAPIYAMARRRLEAMPGGGVPDDAILGIGDGIDTDIRGGLGEGIDTLFVAGGIAAAEVAAPGREEDRDPDGWPDPDRLAAWLQARQLSPTAVIGMLR